MRLYISPPQRSRVHHGPAFRLQQHLPLVADLTPALAQPATVRVRYENSMRVMQNRCH